MPLQYRQATDPGPAPSQIPLVAAIHPRTTSATERVHRHRARHTAKSDFAGFTRIHAAIDNYVASTKGMLTLHFLPGYAPELNPDELVWSHMKRTGVARAPLRRGEKLSDKIEAQLSAIKRTPRLVRSFFQAPTVVYITDC